MRSVSIIIPVYNEENTILKILEKINNEVLSLKEYNFEIIVVDDGSSDNTKNLLEQNKHNYNTLISHSKNTGKGFAVKTATKAAKNDIILIQDADLEYLPENYRNLLIPFERVNADVVYGSRFRTTHYNRVLNFWHYIANNIITLLSNMLTNLNLSDVEVGYKLFKKDVLNQINLNENSFGFEIEVTHKLSKIKPKIKFFETGISYNARNYNEGKKIRFKDALRAIYCIFKYSFFGKNSI